MSDKPPLQRYLIWVEYHGGPFAGWQRQDHAPTVQGCLETAAAALNGAPVTVFGAGRTDAGVHAERQAAHLDLRVDIPGRKIADALNYHLRPHPICVLSAHPVADTFHARFSATARYYRYDIINRRADLALSRGLAWRVATELDAGAMAAGAEDLIGEHDFSTFRDAQCQAASPEKTLDTLTVQRLDAQIVIHCSARSFLHRQVRSMVGSLVEVGRGVRSPDWIGAILAKRDRAACGPVAPADGLYLVGVDYPDP